MRILRDPAGVANLQDPALRALLDERFRDLSGDGPYDPDLFGHFVVAEPGDGVAALEAATGCPILRAWFDDTHFGEPGFAPGFEWVAAHDGYFEVAYILNDDGFGIGLFVPRQPGIDPDLLALCATYATPAPEPEPS